MARWNGSPLGVVDVWCLARPSWARHPHDPARVTSATARRYERSIQRRPLRSLLTASAMITPHKAIDTNAMIIPRVYPLDRLSTER